VLGESPRIRRFVLTTLVLAFAVACSAPDPDRMTIELDEMNDSGISGKVELEPVGERRTRITVVELEGGEITGARVMPDACSPEGLDDKFPIRPPSGVVQIPFDELRKWDEVAAAFMNRGRYVACGER
jgi:hypothetical protein